MSNKRFRLWFAPLTQSNLIRWRYGGISASNYRIFVVFKDEVPFEKMPPVLADVLSGYKFFEKNDRDGVPVTLGILKLDSDHDLYFMRLNTLAHHVAAMLRTMKPVPSPSAKRSPHLTDHLSWTIPEAMEDSEFRKWLSSFHEMMEDHQHDGDYLVTLYGKPFGLAKTTQEAVGSFYYDLLYLYNLRDAAWMFGPVIENDFRSGITFADPRPFELGRKIVDPPTGSFNHREETNTSYWFKLGQEGQEQYAVQVLPDKEVVPEQIEGLLSIMSRKGEWNTLFGSGTFIRQLEKLEVILHNLIDLRRERVQIWYNLLSVHWRRTPTLDAILSKRLIAPHDIETFFECISALFVAGSESSGSRGGASPEEGSFTVFLYNRSEKQLERIWSNGANCSNLTTDPKAPSPLLPVLVVNNSGHKPLLIHNLQQRSPQVQPINTGLDVGADLIVPILGAEGQRELLGVIDIQSSDPERFDTDDVQRVYLLCERYVSKLLRALSRDAGRRETLGTLVPHLTRSRAPNYYEYADELMRGRVIAQKVREVRQIEFQPGRHCDGYKCPYCYGVDQNPMDGDLSAERFLEVLEEIADQFPLVQISGVATEPLTYKEILPLLEGVKEKGLACGLHTKGFRLDDKLMRVLTTDVGDQDSFVTISLDAARAENYIAIHGLSQPNGEEYFEQVIANIQSLHKIRESQNSSLRINIACLLFKDNCDPTQTQQFVDMVQDYCDVIRFSAPHVPNNSRVGQNYLGPDGARILGDLKTRYESNEKVRVLDETHRSEHTKTSLYCYAQAFQIVIDRAGNVFPCPQTALKEYRQLCLGNVCEESLLDILSGRKRIELLDKQVTQMECGVCDRKDEDINSRLAGLLNLESHPEGSEGSSG